MKIGIDAGHCLSGADTGARKYIIEEQETRRVAKEVIRLLRAKGHTVIDLSVDHANTVGQSLSARYNKANASDLDLVASIHFNAGQGVGTEIFTYRAEQHTYAVRTLNNLVELGFRNRGVKDGYGLAMISNTKATAMLVEVCFVDSSDADKYKQLGAEKVAKAIANGIDPSVDESNKEINKVVTSREEDHWSYKDVIEMNEWFICNGTEGINELRLEDEIKRGEIISLLNRFRKAVEK